MIPIKDRLNAYTSTVLSAYLGQLDVEPEMAFIMRCGDYLDHRLTRSEIVPGIPVELTANIAP